MKKIAQMIAVATFAFFVTAGPLLAQDTSKAPTSPAQNAEAAGGFRIASTPVAAAGIGAALTIIGAGLGFGKIGAAALESMARQPEVAGRIFTAMLIIGAFLEGATLFALIVCIVCAGKGDPIFPTR